MFRRLIIPTIAAIIVSIVATVVWSASPPPIITYQGKVLVSGSPASTTLPMQFTIYNALSGGTALYTASGSTSSPTNITVTTTQGLFTVYLGDNGTNPIDPSIFKDNDTLYLQVVINGETLTPRKRLAATPYALNSKYLDGHIATSTPTTTNYIPVSDASGNFSFNDVTSTNLYITGNAVINSTTTFPNGIWGSDGKVGIGTTTFSSEFLGGPIGTYIPRFALQQPVAELSGISMYAASGTILSILGGLPDGVGLLTLYNNSQSVGTPSTMLRANETSYMASSSLFIGGNENIGSDKLRVAGDVNITNGGLLKFNGVSGTPGYVLMVSTTTGLQEWAPTSSLGITGGGGSSLPSGTDGQTLYYNGDWQATDVFKISSTLFSVAAGRQNSASGLYSMVGGGNLNYATGMYSSVVGGRWNTSTENYSSIVGGSENIASGTASFIGGGNNNSVLNSNAVVVGGNNNYNSGQNAFIGAGENNRTYGAVSFIGAGGGTGGPFGGGNTISEARGAFIGAGASNYIGKPPSSIYYPSSIVGGLGNRITEGYSFIGGGENNMVTQQWATVVGGLNNTSSGQYSFIGGGLRNIASGTYSFVGGGRLNIASGSDSFVGGGWSNIASGTFSFVGGGVNNIASGQNSIALGRYTNVTGINSFLLNVSSSNSVATLTQNYVIALMGGNVGVGTTSPSSLLTIGNSAGFQVNNSGNLVKINGVNYGWPTAQGTASTTLINDGAGNLIWAPASTTAAPGAVGDNMQVQFNNSGGLAGSPNFVWDYTNNRLGVGTSTPNESLTLSGNLNIINNGLLKFNGSSGTPGYILMVSTTTGLQEWAPTSSLGISGGGGSLPSGVIGQILVNNGTTNWVASSAIFVSSSGNIGIGTTAPSTKLTLSSDGGILAMGTFNSGSSVVPTGAGARMFWYPRAAAFRAGYVTGTQWNTIANYSTAFGYNNKSDGQQSFAAGGYQNTAGGTASFATGRGNLAYGDWSFAAGYDNIVSAGMSTVFGGQNLITASGYGYSFIGGGLSNTIDGGNRSQHSFIGGGNNNKIINSSNHHGSFIGGGAYNNITNSEHASIIGGLFNDLSDADYSFIGGGVYNDISGNSSFIAGGEVNSITGAYSSIFGRENTIGGTGGVLSSFALGQSLEINESNIFGINVSSSLIGTENRIELNRPNTIILFGGNVGVGTTTPDYHLTVQGDINFTGDLYKNGTLFSSGGGSLPSGMPGQLLINDGDANWVTSSVISINSSTGFISINGIVYDWPNVQGGVSSTLMNDGTGKLIWGYASTTAVAAGGSDSQIQFNSSNVLAGDSNFIWDNVNKRLGIGTSTPLNALSVVGGINLASGTPSNTSSALYNVDGALYWNGSEIGSGGGGTPAGSDGYIQFNNSGSFGATSSFFWDKVNGRLGIGTSTPGFKLTMANDGGILAIGNGDGLFNQQGVDLNVTGTGTRMIWYPKKGAFRAGGIVDPSTLGFLTNNNIDQWDDVNIGALSFAANLSNVARGGGSSAFGIVNNALGDVSFVGGGNNTSSGFASLAFGLGNISSATSSAVFGTGNESSGENSFAVGWLNTASGKNSFVGGTYSSAAGEDSFAYGQYATAYGARAFSLGSYTQAATGSVAIGSGSISNPTWASGLQSVAIGSPSQASGYQAVAIGYGAGGHATGSIALGNVGIRDGADYSVGLNASSSLFNMYTPNVIALMGGNVGVGTTSPTSRLTIDNDGGILAVGTFNSGNSTLPSGAGTRMLWYPRKAAFRAGYTTGDRWDNINIGIYSVALGESGTALGTSSAVLGGRNSTSTGWGSVIAGGAGNKAIGEFTFIGGGSTNEAVGDRSIVLGGNLNFTGGVNTFVGGGQNNNAFVANSFVAGGNNNTASGTNAFVSGHYNTALGEAGFIGGGSSSTISGNYSFIGGGQENSISGQLSSINGGYSNSILSDYSFIGGGYTNSINGTYSFISGGRDNSITKNFSFIAAGENSSVSGLHSVAFGQGIDVQSNYSFGIGLDNTGYTINQLSTMAIMGGKVGIGTVSPVDTLEVCAGAICGAVSSSTGDWYVSSDASLKKNITDFTGGLEKVLSLRPVGYEFNNEADASGTSHIGFIAQELEKIIPQLVKTNPNNGLKSLAYANLTPILVQAIQEQQAQIDALKNASTTLTIQNDGSQIVYTVDMGQDMLGRPLLNVASIIGANNKWEIDTNGTLITKVTTASGIEKKLYGMSSENAEITLSGTSTLENGEARIIFTSDIQEIIDETQPIKVIFSLTSPCNKNIYVSEKSKEGFVLKMVDGNESGITFDWMVLVKRKFSDPFAEEIILENGSEESVTEILDETETTTSTEEIPLEEEMVEPVVEEAPVEEEIPTEDPVVEEIPANEMETETESPETSSENPVE